jgi:hypothetical protein
MADEDRTFDPPPVPPPATTKRQPARRRKGAPPGTQPPATGFDPHAVGEDDRPEGDWGEAADPEATFSANHSRRPVRTEAERGQGAKTRRKTKDIISRRT